MKSKHFLVVMPAAAILLLSSLALAVDTQAHRKKNINTYISLGWFTKVVIEEGYPQVYVTPAFLAFPHKDQEGLVAVVYHYHFDLDPRYDQVIVREAATGKKIGLFSKTVGGLKMER
ncbi:MAG: hypothetical protein AB1641_09640 [Thermodesulfobacteriota bacterium]